MISVSVAEVPTFLKCGGYYKSLHSKESGGPDKATNETTDGDAEDLSDLLEGLKLAKPTNTVDVPADAFKADDSVTCNEDLVNLLVTLQFWTVPQLPFSVSQFILADPTFTAPAEIKSFYESFPTLQHLIDIQNMESLEMRTCHAIYMGLVDALRVFHEQDYKFLAESCSLAAQAGQLEVLEYLVSIGFSVDDRTCDTAVKAGSMECLTYLHTQGAKGTVVSTLHAATNGQLDMLKYLHEQHYAWDATVCAGAARGGHTECLQFLHEYRCPWDESTAVDAASEGHLDCLTYAHTHGAPLYHDLCLAAALKGHVDCLKYAHDIGMPWNERTSLFTAQFGMLNTLQYLHEEGYPWTSDLALTAAAFGRYDCLKYAVEHGCEWDNERWEQALSQAANPADAEALRTNLKNNCAQS